MASLLINLILILSLFATLFLPVTPQSCNSFTFPNDINFKSCKDLPVLDSSIHWNYYASSRAIEVAFKKANAKESSWVAWAINPTSSGMVGSQAFVAIRRSDSDGTLRAYTSPLTSYATTLQEGNLSFPVRSVSASYRRSSIIIFASFQLLTNATVVSHVWQEGLVGDDGTLRAHSFSGPNVQSFGTLDFASGKGWKYAYVGIIISIVTVALVLGVVTWFCVCNNKVTKKEEVDTNQEQA
ncbi:hypothetical protein RIF29_26697 [Crotalaria pallida]|uniref:DOMON domain-containing protein n=1 Tax=Crotalaria pallida TaxID=3830 RepID=A0AAN9EMZ5_CROPI